MSRITQRDIARLAGVSQAVVSLVLNNRTDATTRIAPETRQRVLDVIRETGYAADPVARRMVRQHNQILGVFTYESVFPSTSADFYYPFLRGIEECAEQLRCDLLLFTSAPVTDGRRKVFHENNRLRIADGCLLLGRDIPHDELARLNRENYPFVAVGRRDDAGGPVPCVGADYAAATRELVDRARQLGHREFAYVGAGEGAESADDRMTGFRAGTRGTGRHERTAGRSAGETLDALLAAGVTTAVVEGHDDGVALIRAARERGVDVPGDLSVMVTGVPAESADTGIACTGFRIPRREMGWQSVELLAALLKDESTTTLQRLLPCHFVEGQTLGEPRRDRS
ncbi:LacI family DNA-binding transcriptional regulator [Streptomyces sp. NPDC052051]|uniref:LacI family DNA-binding transcriptional regulator n=1 Tax=Streptomyces sp. NPDC052051 TaxID=3154649 RepID=UPI0034460F9A